jgi:hypothetical protein
LSCRAPFPLSPGADAGADGAVDGSAEAGALVLGDGLALAAVV